MTPPPSPPPYKDFFQASRHVDLRRYSFFLLSFEAVILFFLSGKSPPLFSHFPVFKLVLRPLLLFGAVQTVGSFSEDLCVQPPPLSCTAQVKAPLFSDADERSLKIILERGM